MAERFGADPQVAAEVARELAAIRADMTATGELFAGYRGATGSERVESALDDFYADSSDNREKMDQLLERASALLRGLAEGTAAVDQGLVGSLEPAPAPAAPAAAGGAAR